MEDNKNNSQNTEEKTSTSEEKAVVKIAAVKAVRMLTADSKWSILQEKLQEIHASHIVVSPDTRPSTPVMLAELRQRIEDEYETDSELKQLLLDGIPSIQAIYRWFKKPEWQEAVWGKIRTNGQFSNERRTAMMNAIYERGLKRSDNAAKLWLTLSGDYQEKANDVSKDKTLETFREINTLLHKKKDPNNE